MKTTTYRTVDGKSLTVEYDENGPCRLCGLPVVAASMGGTDVCPWCDLGECRFTPGHRVDFDWDQETGRIALPSKHYERYHPKETRNEETKQTQDTEN